MFSVPNGMAETLTITSGFLSAFKDFAPIISISGPGFSMGQLGGGDCCGGVRGPFGNVPLGSVHSLDNLVTLGGCLTVHGESFEPVGGFIAITAQPVPIFQTSMSPFVAAGTVTATPFGKRTGPLTTFEIVGAGVETVIGRVNT